MHWTDQFPIGQQSFKKAARVAVNLRRSRYADLDEKYRRDNRIGYTWLINDRISVLEMLYCLSLKREEYQLGLFLDRLVAATDISHAVHIACTWLGASPKELRTGLNTEVHTRTARTLQAFFRDYQKALLTTASECIKCGGDHLHDAQVLASKMGL